MTVQRNIEAKLSAALPGAYLEVLNESHRHNVPPGSESHFKLVVVSDDFEGLNLLRRHQKVNAILAAELEAKIHALSMETLTAAEWAARGGEVMASPECRGGKRG